MSVIVVKRKVKQPFDNYVMRSLNIFHSLLSFVGKSDLSILSDITSYKISLLHIEEKIAYNYSNNYLLLDTDNSET